MKKKVLICGSTGFIGRNLAEALAEEDKYEVIGVYHNKEPHQNEKITFVHADLRNQEDIDRIMKGVDILIQAAATTSGAKDIVNAPYIHVTDNAVMNSLLFRAAYEHKVKHVVFFSCGVMYQPSEIPRKESDFNANAAMVPQYFGVGWTKVYIEKMCEFYSNISETKYTVLRQSNVYGPYDKYDYEHSHVFGASVRKVMDAKDGDAIVVWGNGQECRDLIYVDDIIRFIKLALEKQMSSYELCNVGYGKAFSVQKIVEKIIRFSGKKLEIKYDLTKPSIPTKLTFDISQAQEIFGWKPEITFDLGIKKTLEWYRKENYGSFTNSIK